MRNRERKDTDLAMRGQACIVTKAGLVLAVNGDDLCGAHDSRATSAADVGPCADRSRDEMHRCEIRSVTAKLADCHDAKLCRFVAAIPWTPSTSFHMNAMKPDMWPRDLTAVSTKLGRSSFE